MSTSAATAVCMTLSDHDFCHPEPLAVSVQSPGTRIPAFAQKRSIGLAASAWRSATASAGPSDASSCWLRTVHRPPLAASISAAAACAAARLRSRARRVRAPPRARATPSALPITPPAPVMATPLPPTCQPIRPLPYLRSQPPTAREKQPKGGARGRRVVSGCVQFIYIFVYAGGVWA
eukprot:scaffold247792_cov32-Tisochrysis_lutea.AAC.2